MGSWSTLTNFLNLSRKQLQSSWVITWAIFKGNSSSLSADFRMASVGSNSPAQMFAASSNQYFSLDDILASQERIPLTIKQDLPQLGFLDSQSHYQNDPTILTSGTKLELPLWMAKCLKAPGRAKLDLPQTWSHNQRQIISADANVLDLHKYGPFFYQTGCHLVKLVSKGHNLDEEAETIGGILVDTLTKRFRRIMDASANAEGQDTLTNTGIMI